MVSYNADVPPETNLPKDGSDWGKYRYPGDIRKSGCHDIFGVILWFLLFIGFIVILGFGANKGRIWVFYKSWDTQGLYCGFDNRKLVDEVNNASFVPYDYTNYPYLFFGAGADFKKKQMCVKECPTSGKLTQAVEADTGSTFDITKCTDSTKILCPPGVDSSTLNYPNMCSCSYTTKLLMNRCIPDVNEELTEVSKTFAGSIDTIIQEIPGFASALSSIQSNWVPILVLSICSIIISLLWIMLLRCCTKPLVYIIVIAVPILIIAIGCWFFFEGANAIRYGDDKDSKIVAYVLWAVAALLIVIILFLLKKLKKAIEIMKIASKALGHNLTIFFTPIIAILFEIVFWIIFIFSSLLNYSAGKFTLNDDSKLVIQSDKTFQYLLIYNLIYMVFISVFVYFTSYYGVSGSVVQWYFQQSSAAKCRCAVSYFIGWTKALGTIAITALIMTPLYLFMILMEYIDYKTKKEQEKSCIWKFILKCMKCCLACFERLMRYLNKSLLTISQVYNIGFCRSASKVFDVVLSDIAMTVLLNGISFFIVFLSKVIVSALCAWFAFLWIRYTTNAAGWFLPATIVFILSYLVSTFILNMFDSVIDIIFVCYMSDRKMTSDGAIRPLYGDTSVKDSFDEMKAAQADDNKIDATP